jgi:predicted nucleic acid-binding protein
MGEFSHESDAGFDASDCADEGDSERAEFEAGAAAGGFSERRGGFFDAGVVSQEEIGAKREVEGLHGKNSERGRGRSDSKGAELSSVVIYLDTGVLVRALLTEHPQHNACAKAIGEDAVSSCHSLAEVFNTLTGFFKIPNDTASEMIVSLTEAMAFEVISQADYMGVIEEARRRGVQGGIVYDAIHAQVARRLRVDAIVSYNVTNFRHVAPEMDVVTP